MLTPAEISAAQYIDFLHRRFKLKVWPYLTHCSGQPFLWNIFTFAVFSPLLRANCFKSLYVFSSAAGHLETHRAMDLILLLIMSRLQGSRKKTYLIGGKTLEFQISCSIWSASTTFPPEIRNYFPLNIISVFGHHYASWDFSVWAENERWWHLPLCHTDPSL